MSEKIDKLELNGNTYTKIKYSALNGIETATRYINAIVDNNTTELNKLFLEALKSVSANGEQLKTEMIINNFFEKCPKDIREVRSWALLEGLQSFLSSFAEAPDIEIKYLSFGENQKS